MVGYRPFLIYSREEGVSPVGACSGRCNQSRTPVRVKNVLLKVGNLVVVFFCNFIAENQ